MLRCLSAHEDDPVAYPFANQMFSNLWNGAWHENGRCYCANGPCEAWDERVYSKRYKVGTQKHASYLQASSWCSSIRLWQSCDSQTYSIYDTSLPRPPAPTPAPYHDNKNYTLIGEGQCKKYRYLPEVSQTTLLCVPGANI